nr:maco-A 147 [Mamestra configurata nucleopolyhedrovirus A]
MMEVGTLCLAIDSLIYKLRNINHRLFYLQHCQDFQIPINDDETIRIELALDTIMANFDFLIANVIDKKCNDQETVAKMQAMIHDSIRNDLAMKLWEHVGVSTIDLDYAALPSCMHVLENKKQLNTTNFIKRLTDKNTISDTDLIEMFTYLTYLYVERQDSIVAHIVQNLRNKRALCQELQDRLNNFKINHKLWI